MGGNDRRERVKHSDDKGQTSSSSASRSSSTNHSSSAVSSEDHTFQLPKDAISRIGEYLTPEEEARFRIAKPVLTRRTRENPRSQGISPSLSTFFVPPQRTASYLVLTGRPDYLIQILQKDPTIFFKKYAKSKDAAGQEFYDVSPADLISFICDDDMQMQVNDFAQHLPEEHRKKFFEQWQVHQASRGRGGADLVMVTGENPPQYANICGVTNTFDVFGETLTTQRPLLKNPDGVICWKSPDNQLHWYYVNHDTETFERIDIPNELRAAHFAEYNAFAARMANMEPNTARRSSNQEHALIQTIMRHSESHNNPIHLVREGIHYRQDAIDFIDTHYDFNRLINAYLKCIRLYNNDNNAEGDRVWRAELGHVQREVMWLIQRYCEINRSFKPLADNYKATPFIRDNKIHNYQTGNNELVFDTKSGQFIFGLGLDNPDDGFAIYKITRVRGCAEGGGGATRRGWGARFAGGTAAGDLVAVTRFGIDATQNVDNFKPAVSAALSSKISC